MILVINSGSTSLKCSLFEADTLDLIKKEKLDVKLDPNQDIQDQYNKIFRQAMRQLGGASNIRAIGHRVVHGGVEFIQPLVINRDNFEKLVRYTELAPLHNPYNLAGIKACQNYFPDLPNIAVFDTSFFKDLPDQSKIYALPIQYYKDLQIQRFGFHGISHQSAAQQAAEKLGQPLDKLKLITLHLGGGCSITAIDKGKPIDTSMGFTPLEGLTMMTRAGDIDAGILLKIFKDNLETGLEPQKIIEKLDHLLNFESGIKGLSGFDNYLDLLKAVRWKDKKACLAFDIFIHRIKKYIGAYCAILNKLDAVVFTGAIGAGEKITREKICDKMTILKNVRILTIETNEELAIAQEIKKCRNIITQIV